jgi:hypothetical protein
MRNSGKFIILEKMLRQFVLAERQKVIIFSGFDQALNLCEDVLTHVRGNARGFEYARIDGSTLSAWRNLAIYLFNNNLRYKVFLVSIRAGGEGLNLASASRVIFLDEDWNPQVMRQAEARAHRLGQTKPVTIFKIHSRGTVEEQMVGRLAKKAYLGAKLTENMQTPNSLDELTDMAELKEASNSSNGSVAVIVNFVESLMRQKRLSDNQIDTNTLLSWDWATILENCTDVQSGERDIAESITEEDEQAWLERKERIKTNVFNGAKVEKTTTSWRHPVADNNPELARAERRIGKQRIVLVDGYEVTKGNLSLSEEASSSPASASSAKPKERIVHYPVSPTQQTARTDLTDSALLPLPSKRRRRVPGMPAELPPPLPRDRAPQRVPVQRAVRVQVSSPLLRAVPEDGVAGGTAAVLLPVVHEGVLRAVSGLEQHGVHWDGCVRSGWIRSEERVLYGVCSVQDETEEKGSFWGRIQQADSLGELISRHQLDNNTHRQWIQNTYCSVPHTTYHFATSRIIQPLYTPQPHHQTDR